MNLLRLLRLLRLVIPGCLLGLLLALALSRPTPWAERGSSLSSGSRGMVSPWLFAPPVQAQTLQLIRQEGWLEIEQIRGQVSIQTSDPRPAQVGDRLTKSGDRLTTGPRASTLLTVDRGIGTVQMSQNSVLSIRQIGLTRSGRWITTLNLDRGQVRFRINKEQMPRSSRFEVHGPFGVAGVRGTEFGIILNPSNRMVIGTESGRVEAEAEGETVSLPAETSSVIFPGEPPLPPQPLDRKLELDLREVDYRRGQILLRGSINPLNTIFFNGTELAVSREGEFEQQLPYNPAEELLLRVENAVGDRQDYQFLGLDRDAL